MDEATATLQENLAAAREELRVERCWTANPLPPTVAKTWCEYFVLPFKRRGTVALRQIGTHHKAIDVFGCACLGLPGVVLALALPDASAISCRVRVLIALESAIVAGISMAGDGMLVERLLPLDKFVSAPLHIAACIALLVWSVVTRRVSVGGAVGVFACGIFALASFHSRMYWTHVRQDPIVSRWCGRLWHVAGTLASALLTTLLLVHEWDVVVH